MSAPRVIGLSGLAGAGKDTVADHLINNHGYHKLAFGAKLKDITSELFNLERGLLEGGTPESRDWREDYRHSSGYTPRELLQLVGTQLRAIDSEVWVNYVRAAVNFNLQRGISCVVTDVRFPNELDMINDIGAVWRVTARTSPMWYSELHQTWGHLDYHAPGLGEQLRDVTGQHESETLLSLPSAQRRMAVEILNDSTLESLYRQVDENLHVQEINITE